MACWGCSARGARLCAIASRSATVRAGITCCSFVRSPQAGLRNPAALPNLWYCNLNPIQAFASCEIAEEHWSDSDEDQEEELAPRKSKRLRKSKAPRCAKRTRGDPFLDRWDAIGRDTLKGLCRDLRRNDKDLALTTSPPPFLAGAMREYLRMYYQEG